MQERSEAERRAIWTCLNVATWRRERSDRAIQQIRQNTTAFHSIPAIRSKGSTSVLSTRKIRPIYSHPSRFTSDFVIAVIFGNKILSRDRNVPSFLCHKSRSGRDVILDLGQYLTTDGIVNCPLNLNTDTIHHLVHLPRYPRV